MVKSYKMETHSDYTSEYLIKPVGNPFRNEEKDALLIIHIFIMLGKEAFFTLDNQIFKALLRDLHKFFFLDKIKYLLGFKILVLI